MKNSFETRDWIALETTGKAGLKPRLVIWKNLSCWNVFINDFDNICDIRSFPKEHLRRFALGNCNFRNNNLSFRETIHFDQSDIPAIIPKLLKSVFDNSRGPRIDFNVAIKVQRSLIADYINNFRQGKCSRGDIHMWFFARFSTICTI